MLNDIQIAQQAQLKPIAEVVKQIGLRKMTWKCTANICVSTLKCWKD